MHPQDAEKGRQLRSRLIEILNVPLRVRLQFRFVCGLADDLFEHLAWRARTVSALGVGGLECRAQ